MRLPKTKSKHWLSFLFIAVVCVFVTACGTVTPGTAGTATGGAVARQAPPCGALGCPNLGIAQSGKISRYSLSAQGIRAAAPVAQPAEQIQNNRWIIDTGLPSPDGQWIACTTIGSETGGPILLQNTATGEWTNLIDTVNARLPQGQVAFPMEAMWDVIGWFPDSARLMIGPADLSQVTIITLADYSARQIPFPGGGRGGRLFANLAPDGSRFSYIGEDAAANHAAGNAATGEQVINVVDLQSGKTTTLLKQPYAEGILYNPRFSPADQQMVYTLQKGSPESGLTYSLNLLAPGEAQPRVLVSGNLGLTVATWSPDGRQIAFTRSDASEPQRVLPNAAPQPQPSNIWIVSLADGKATQLTFQNGQARSPAWAKDSQLIAFVTEDGQVQLVNTGQPGKTWQAAGPSSDPALTSAFFLP
jgi:Tol biopolymer transport system component